MKLDCQFLVFRDKRCSGIVVTILTTVPPSEYQWKDECYVFPTVPELQTVSLQKEICSLVPQCIYVN